MSKLAGDTTGRTPSDCRPKNPVWSDQPSQGPRHSVLGGQGFDECRLLGVEPPTGNVEDWRDAQMSLANRFERLGDEALAGEHFISARDCYLRASSYYRSAEFFLSPSDPRRLDAYGRARDCFHRALRYLSPPVEAVDVPYEGTALYGYFCHPRNPEPGLYRSLILIGGADSTGEEAYSVGAKAAVERGFACLVVDAPGQGASLRLRNIHSRYDFEVAVKAAVDYLYSRPEVDRDRIALMAYSTGGYYAPRGAAFEKRVRACVVWGACYDMASLISVAESSDSYRDRLTWLLGAKDFDEAKKLLETWTLKGVVDKLSCPLFILHDEADAFLPVDHAYRTYEDAQCDKELRILKKGAPDTLYCQHDSRIIAHYHIFNWLEEKLR